MKILAQSIQQLYELRQILSTGKDTLTLMRDINRGIRDGLRIIQIINPKFNPGLYGSLETADQVQRAIEDLYGVIPQTSEYRLQEAQDRSVSESIAMNGTLFQYADSVDQETRRIIEHSQSTNPQGAAKLTNQSLAVLIGVTTQVLRTNSMMLKMMGQNMALSNRKEKLQAQQFKTQYEGISDALGGLPKETKLAPLGTETGR
ncbi:MAG: hypothetical protein AB7I27_19635 [Bacteriovoracaceae bacterium]